MLLKKVMISQNRNRMNTKLFFISVLFVVLGFTSCDNTRVYESWKDMPSLMWHKDSAHVVAFNIEDSTSFYNMNVGIRNTNSYPYRNLWLMVDISGPECFCYQDTVRIDLADNSGRWLGERSASFYSYVVPLYKKLLFSNAGEYVLSIKQGMRKDELEGVVSLGLRVETVE